MKKISLSFLVCILFTLPSFAQSDTDLIDKDIYTVVEKMPVYPGCETYESLSERNDCSNDKTIQFISEHTKYPKEAKENNVKGIVYLRYIVDENGDVGNIEVVRGVAGDYGNLLDEEGKRVIAQLPKMQAGEQKGKKVKVQYTMPIRFNLPASKEGEK